MKAYKYKLGRRLGKKVLLMATVFAVMMIGLCQTQVLGAEVFLNNGKKLIINSFEAAKLENRNLDKRKPGATVIGTFKSIHGEASCTLFETDMGAMDDEKPSLHEHIWQYVKNPFSRNVDLPLPDNREYASAMDSYKKQDLWVIEQNFRVNFASEMQIASKDGKEGYVNETGYIALKGAVLKFTGMERFRNGDVQKAILNIKELDRDVVRMLFLNDRDAGVWRKSEGEHTVADLNGRTQSYFRSIADVADIFKTTNGTFNRDYQMAPEPARDLDFGFWFTIVFFSMVIMAYFYVEWGVDKLYLRTLYMRLKSRFQNREWFASEAGRDGDNNNDSDFGEFEDDELEFTIDECYAILELDEGLGFAAVKHRYRLLAQIYHPDKIVAGGDARAWATEKFGKINLAYGILKKHFGE